MLRSRWRSAGAPLRRFPARQERRAVVRKVGSRELPRRKAAHAQKRMGGDRRRDRGMLLLFNRFRRGVSGCF